MVGPVSILLFAVTSNRISYCICFGCWKL
jgi:hypothetical protein